ncbi:MAG: substrate-binding domain-containing protein [Thiotrichales bacterium]|jgi:ABC-type sugar transport system substrate-binding protein|nr:substrate-binding domain-containing protein [Thiotrichales bacterium]MBT3854949.1 substrate-binding domain-containing protein [Thiotrichales bacterium]MBT4653531.1 substrate-binding domain-containing protein [Thiotrichales bacterium]MBT5499325.1 substrate-binding domain-containing protein [Thiotrichales bacterium]MBT5984666.1 substrate-binding domain-containing protein [Thiotrichales bacterium]
MRKMLLVFVLLATTFAGSSYALTIGFSVARFDDNFLTVMRNDAVRHAEEMGYTIQVDDAKDDVTTQLSQVQNYIASGVDAIIVTAIDTDTTQAMTKAAESAGVPLVYVNRQPIDLDDLGASTTFVGSNEKWSGTLAAFEMCVLAGGTGKAVMLMGQLSNEAARSRSEDFREVIRLSMCNGIELIEEQTANWSRLEANDLMTNWISAGLDFNIVFGNNDEMAIGAIQALKSAGISMDDVIVGGVDATEDALMSMQAGDLDVTVFQNAAAQGAGAVDAAADLVAGKSLPNFVVIPFELVTPRNLDQYLGQN